MGIFDSKKKIIQQREHYAHIAEHFDEKYNRENVNHYYKIEEIEKAFLTYLLPREQGWDFMEVGAGSGIHAEHFAGILGEKIKSFLLSDLSPEMLKKAQRRLSGYSNIEYMASPAEEITTVKKFDGIYVSGSMHHFADYKQAIFDMSLHLKKGGVIVICEPNVWNPINFFKALNDYSLEVGQFTVTRKNVIDTLVDLNFEILSSRVLHYKSGNSILKGIYPYKELEKIRMLNSFAIMFLIVARLKE